MKISTIILNWNRCELLQDTVRSYLSTIEPPFDLMIIDNGSSDNSPTYLTQLHKENPSISIMLLDENKGGEALNNALPKVTGDLVHFSENDQYYKSGWSSYVRDVFEKFPNLGQLSLFGPVPTDNEAWEPKPCKLAFSKGMIVYKAAANCGTSSIIRTSIMREHGIEVSNIKNEQNEFKFPDDGKLSQDIKNSGYFCAYSNKYYVENIGHHVEEFRRIPTYYEHNYDAKSWLGRDGWKKRIQIQAETPRPVRQSHLFPDEFLSPEKTVPDVLGKPALLWSMLDGYTAEVETLEFLYALVRLTKPNQIVETGTWIGYSSVAMALALSQNGFGHLTTLEKDRNVHAEAIKLFLDSKVAAFINAINMDSLEYHPTCSFDMCLFDSANEIRAQEFKHYASSIVSGALIVFHDTAPHHASVGDDVSKLVAEGLIAGIELPTPRGLFVGLKR